MAARGWRPVAKVWAIARREWGAYFLSPVAWVVLGVFLLLTGCYFAASVLSTSQADLRPVLGFTAALLLFIAPALTTRLWSEELRQGTDELLYTAPVSTAQVVLGKFLGALAVLVLYLLLTGVYPLLLRAFARPDLRAAAAGFLGLLLLGAAALAAGLFASSLTESQVVAGVVGFGLLLLFWIAGWLGDVLPGWPAGAVRYLALLPHFDDFGKGVLDTSHVIYLVSLTGGFLFLTARRLEAARWR